MGFDDVDTIQFSGRFPLNRTRPNLNSKAVHTYGIICSTPAQQEANHQVAARRLLGEFEIPFSVARPPRRGRTMENAVMECEGCREEGENTPKKPALVWTLTTHFNH